METWQQISIRNKYLVSRDWVKCKVTWPRRYNCIPVSALHHATYVNRGVECGMGMPCLQVFGRDITDA